MVLLTQKTIIMKKIFFLAAIAATLVISISSCAKKDEPEDLTSQIVGVYSGTVNLDGTPTSNQSLTVTKLSNTKIQIKPTSSADDISTFSVELTKVTDGTFKFTVVSAATSGGDIISGNTNVSANDPTLHGTYINSSQALTYSIILTPASGSSSTESYTGTK